jgi:hypothetical protein
MGLPVETGSGGRTKWNRTRFGLEKTHWLDAACVGKVETLTVLVKQPLLILCVGHGNRQTCRTDKYGFPSRHKSRNNVHFGFQTGDMVKAIVTTGKKIGVHLGKVACRAAGSFNINMAGRLIQGISHKYCRVIHKKDGYSYSEQKGRQGLAKPVPERTVSQKDSKSAKLIWVTLHTLVVSEPKSLSAISLQASEPKLPSAISSRG